MSEDTKAELTLDQKLAAARERKADRERAADDVEKLLELERLDLEEKYEKELGGKLGEKFAVVPAGHRGHVVLKLGQAVQHKLFNTTIDENQKKGVGGRTGVTEEACHKFVRPSVVHPSIEEFKSICEELPGVLYRCSGVLQALFDADRQIARGK